MATNSGSLEAEQGSHSFFQRLVGFLRFDLPTYDEIAADPGAIWQALAVVVVAAAAAVVGTLPSHPDPVQMAMRFAGELAQWAVFAGLAHFTGITLFRPPRYPSLIEHLRLFGFAQAPMVLTIFTALPGLLGNVLPLVGTGILLVYAVAIFRASCGFDVRKAVICAIFTYVVATGLIILIQMTSGANLSVLPVGGAGGVGVAI